MVHELSPCYDHDGACVVVEALIGVHGAWHHSRQRQVATSMRNTRRVDAVGEQWADQSVDEMVGLAGNIIYDITVELLDIFSIKDIQHTGQLDPSTPLPTYLQFSRFRF